jgi:hypothetical protein
VFDYDSPEAAEQEVINAVLCCLHLLQKNKYITDQVIAFQRAQKKRGDGIEKVVLSMTEDFSFIEEGEELTVEEWQRLEADKEQQEVVQRENEEDESESAVTSSCES